MTAKREGMCVFLTMLAVGTAGLLGIPSYAGSPVIGFLARSMDATVGGQAAASKATLFDGDRLRVNEGGSAVVALNNGGRAVLGQNTEASFLREAENLTINLERGKLSMFQPQGNKALRVNAGGISILPARGFRTLGEVALLNGQLSLTAKEGTLHVEGAGPVREIPKGKTVVLRLKSPNQAAPANTGAGGAAAALHGHALAGGIAAAGAGGAVAAGAGASGHGGSSNQGAGNGGGGTFVPSEEKNPTAVGQVGSHVPPQACQHAASPSVPAVACQE